MFILIVIVLYLLMKVWDVLAPVLNVGMAEEELQRGEVSDKDLVQPEDIHVQYSFPANNVLDFITFYGLKLLFSFLTIYY